MSEVTTVTPELLTEDTILADAASFADESRRVDALQDDYNQRLADLAERFGGVSTESLEEQIAADSLPFTRAAIESKQAERALAILRASLVEKYRNTSVNISADAGTPAIYLYQFDRFQTGEVEMMGYVPSGIKEHTKGKHCFITDFFADGSFRVTGTSIARQLVLFPNTEYRVYPLDNNGVKQVSIMPIDTPRIRVTS